MIFRQGHVAGVPRIRGRIGQITEPAEHCGKWAFELEIGTLGGGDFEKIAEVGPFETEQLAKAELIRVSKLACETYEKAVDGAVSGRYVDMKTNQTRFWDKRDEH